MKTLSEKLKDLKVENGSVKEVINGETYNIILIGQAFNSCQANKDDQWEAPAIMVNMDGTYDIGSVYWDFSDFVKGLGAGYVIDDDSIYPFDDDPDFVAQAEGLTVEDDKDEIAGWVGDFK